MSTDITDAEFQRAKLQFLQLCERESIILPDDKTIRAMVADSKVREGEAVTQHRKLLQFPGAQIKQ